MEENNRNSIVKAGLILALAIAGFFGYLYFTEKQENQKKTQEIQSKNVEIISTHSKLDSIARELDIKMAEMVSMGKKIDEIEQIKQSLVQDKSNLLRTQSINMNEYNSKIKKYEDFLNQKDKELAILRQENSSLFNENQGLSKTNTVLKTTNSDLETEKVALKDTVKRYAEENRNLVQKVTIGAALRPIGYLVTAINRRGKERDGDAFKGKKVDRIKLSFTLAENPLTKIEQKIIYMRLLDPVGNVISDMNLGSGTFNFGGKETVYTAKQTINYTNDLQNVDFIYDRDTRYEKGNYKVEIYAEGFRVGQTQFFIK